MIVETHMIAWNRSETIAMSINHYKKLGRVILYDNFSEDNTREIAQECGAEIQLFGTKGVLSDQHYLDVKNHCWKNSKADWVIVVDDDEILLWDYNKYNLLKEAFKNGYTIIQPQGYSIYSNEMPIKNWLEIKTGFPDDKYSKLCCFNPKAITEVNYSFGCHPFWGEDWNKKFQQPNGYPIRVLNEGSLYHYHGVGGAERMIKRHQLYEPRRQKSPVNMRWNLGAEYGYSPESKRKWFKEQLEKSSILFEAGTHL